MVGKGDGVEVSVAVGVIDGVNVTVGVIEGAGVLVGGNSTSPNGMLEHASNNIPSNNTMYTLRINDLFQAIILRTSHPPLHFTTT